MHHRVHVTWSLLVAGAVLLPAAPATAGVALSVTPLTWNVLGLDSNRPSDGPDRYPVGARVCNRGTVVARGVVARFAFTTASSHLTLYGPSALAKGDLAPGRCADAYFEVRVARTTAAYGARRGFRITANDSTGATASTPQPRELYVEKLISQNRNAVISITGPTTVYVGRTYTFALQSQTAPGGYEQLESHMTFPPDVLELVAVDTRYGAPAGATNDTVYADACGWDEVPTSPTYLSCVGPHGYPGGKAGDGISTRYTVRVRAAGRADLTGLIYDKSGSSFHYNGDYGEPGNRLVVTAVEPPDLALTKTHAAAPWPVGSDQVWALAVRNVGGSPTAGTTTVTDTLPAGATPLAASGPGWTCTVSGQTVTCRTTSVIAVGVTSVISVRVRVGARAPDTLVNVARVTTPYDDNPANDTGRDEVPVTRPATGPPPAGPSGTGPDPAPGPGLDPGSGPGPTGPSGPATGGGNPLHPRGGPASPAARPAPTGPLPYTGAGTDVAVRWALAVLVSGACFLVAGSRRREAVAVVVRPPRHSLSHGSE